MTRKDMDKTAEYREMLQAPFSQKMVNRITNEIIEYPERLDALYPLVSDHEITVSWRAAWVCDKLVEKHPEWFYGRQAELTQLLISSSHSGTRRVLLSLLYDLPVAEPFPVDLLDFCFSNMLNSDQSTGVQALCIKTAYKLCLKEPELMPELELYLETAEPEYYTIGVRTTIRNIKQKLTRNKFSL